MGPKQLGIGESYFSENTVRNEELRFEEVTRVRGIYAGYTMSRRLYEP
jgi:hypothetical protein